MIAPLKKCRRDGRLYTRDDNVEAKLVELASLPRDELVSRCEMRRRGDPAYVPSECVMHFVRATRLDTFDLSFERLYKILAERVLSALPRPDSRDRKTTSLTRSIIRDKAFGRFVELLSSDRSVYSEKLDYFEVRFDGALASVRRDAQEQAWRDENRSITLELDEETGEPSGEVERAAVGFDPFNTSKFSVEAYRSRLDAAIESLPPEQGRIVEMIRQGIPIDSKEDGAVTIAKALRKSEKTIRTYRDKAYAALRAALSEGEGS